MKKYLLDTHIILWLAENSSNLSEVAKAAILDDSAEKYASVASCWEVSIKLSLNKLELEGGTNEFFRIISENGFQLLDITQRQLAVLETLPFYHKDPFDRLLIASAIADEMTFVTADASILAYKGEGVSFVS
ncbi:MAG: type II toxin-antitoxin system VapC family toxin [Acidobacteriota bacterium]|jgi:PIN domain nuclease of toxin-antitoxin system|nr:type II toxin-antitoxin system VapC family toxin [Acidobacteriota bacterium]